MTYQNKFTSIALSLIVSSLIVGCSDSSVAEDTAVTTYRGTVIDPEIQGANVFLDANENGLYDSGELNTTTDDYGQYSINLPQSAIGKALVMMGGVDRVTKEEFLGSLSALVEATQREQNITPLTSLMHQYKRVNSDKTLDEVRSELSQKLGINADDFDKDIVANGNERLLKVALQVQKVAESIKENSVDTLDIKSIYETVIEKLASSSELSDALKSTITAKLPSESLAQAKVEDLNLEISELDIADLDADKLALTIANIKDSIQAVKEKSALGKKLHLNPKIRVEDDAKAKTEKGRRTLNSLGLADIDSGLKDKILGHKDFDFENSSFKDLRAKLDDLNLTKEELSTVKREEFFSSMDFDQDMRGDLKKRFDSNDFDFSMGSQNDFMSKMQEQNFFGNDSDLQEKIQAKLNTKSGIANGSNIVGSIIKGPIDGAEIRLLDASGALVTSVFSQKGIFNLGAQTLSSAYYVVESRGGSYEDEATKSIVAIDASRGLKALFTKEELQSIISNKESIAMTPESTIFTEIVLNDLSSGADVESAMSAAKSLITSTLIMNSSPMPSLDGDVFLEVGDFTTAFPKGPSEAFARNRAISFSYMLRDLDMNASEVFTLLDLVVDDLKDGKSDGITLADGRDVNVSEKFALARTKLFQNTTGKLMNGELSDGQRDQLQEMGFDTEMFGGTMGENQDNLAEETAKYLSASTLPTLHRLPLLSDEDGNNTDAKETYTLSANTNVDVTIETPEGSWVTPMWRYNNSALPVVIRAQRGDAMTLNLNNKLASDSTIHWHGFKIPAIMDGGPDVPVAPNASKAYTFTMQQPAAPLWFHPHPDMQTGKQVYMGLAGVYLLEDSITKELESSKQIPSGEKDTVLLVQDRRFAGSKDDARRELLYMNKAQDSDGMIGNTILVNGSVLPKQEVSNTKHRYRLYNVSNARNYDFALSDSKKFTVIGTDGGLLKNPVEVDHIVLGPAERVEIVIDFATYSVGDKVMLISKAFSGDMMSMMGSSDEDISETSIPNMGSMGSGMGRGMMQAPQNFNGMGGMGSISSMFANSNGGGVNIMRFDITKEESEDITLYSELPQNAEIYNRIPESSADNVGNEREFLMSMDMGTMGGMSSSNGMQMSFVINGKSFKADRVDEFINAGATEIWSITNMSPMAHPFHAHAIQYQILTRNGVAATGTDLGWKDTFLVQPGQTVRVIGEFDGEINKGDYMYHCHILEHEDAGMMGYFRIGDSGNLDTLYPNVVQQP